MMMRSDETDEVLDDGKGRAGGELARPREHSDEEMARHAERRRLAAERRHGQHHPRGVSDGRS